MQQRFCWLCLAAVAPVAAAQPMSIIDLGQVPNWTASRGRAISGDGQWAIGESGDAILTFTVPFLWSAGTGAQRLGPGTGIGAPQGISYDGSVVCGFGPNNGWRWTPSGVQFIGTPVGPAIWYGVSGDGTRLVGNSGGTAWYWTEAGGAVNLGDLPGGATQSFVGGCSFDGRVIVGQGTRTSFTREAFRWTAESGMVGLGVPPWASSSYASCVSADGSVIAGAASERAFRWTAETGIVPLGSLGAKYPKTDAKGVSADGAVIVGDAYGSSAGATAYIWTLATGVESLEDVLRRGGANLEGWILLSAMGISADGTRITGTARHNGVIAAYIAVIPGPGSALPLLGGVLLMRRRRGSYLS